MTEHKNLHRQNTTDKELIRNQEVMLQLRLDP
jgi:hypothetical protein